MLHHPCILRGPQQRGQNQSRKKTKKQNPPTQNTQFFQENPIIDENQIGPNLNTTPVHRFVRDGPYPSG